MDSKKISGMVIGSLALAGAGIGAFFLIKKYVKGKNSDIVKVLTPSVGKLSNTDDNNYIGDESFYEGGKRRRTQRKKKGRK